MIVVSEKKRALYFGSLGDGHFLYLGPADATWRYTLDPNRADDGFPWHICHLDTGLLTNGKVADRYTGEVHWTCGGSPLWLAFFWWDRSEDKRGASNSGFYVLGFSHHEAEDAFQFACEQWPQVVARQRFPLRIVNRPSEVKP